MGSSTLHRGKGLEVDGSLDRDTGFEVHAKSLYPGCSQLAQDE